MKISKTANASVPVAPPRRDLAPRNAKSSRKFGQHTMTLNETHDPSRKSFIESANQSGCDFPIQNLPFGVFHPAPGAPPRVGVAIGDQILDVAAAGASFDGLAAQAARSCGRPSLNELMGHGSQAWSALRLALAPGP